MTNVNVDQSIKQKTIWYVQEVLSFKQYDGVSYNFVCNDSIVLLRKRNFTWKNINVQQGQYITDQFIFDNQIKNSKFVLSNAGVDKSTLEVSVNSGELFLNLHCQQMYRQYKVLVKYSTHKKMKKDL